MTKPPTAVVSPMPSKDKGNRGIVSSPISIASSSSSLSSCSYRCVHPRRTPSHSPLYLWTVPSFQRWMNALGATPMLTVFIPILGTLPSWRKCKFDCCFLSLSTSLPSCDSSFLPFSSCARALPHPFLNSLLCLPCKTNLTLFLPSPFLHPIAGNKRPWPRLRSAPVDLNAKLLLQQPRRGTAMKR